MRPAGLGFNRRVDSVQLREVLGRVLFEFADAGFAAKFDLLIVVDFGDDLAHRAQFVVGDKTGLEGIGFRGKGDPGGKNEGGEDDKSLFHR